MAHWLEADHAGYPKRGSHVLENERESKPEAAVEGSEAIYIPDEPVHWEKVPYLVNRHAWKNISARREESDTGFNNAPSPAQ